MKKKKLTIVLLIIAVLALTNTYCIAIKSFNDVANEYGMTPEELEENIEKGISPQEYKTQQKSSKATSQSKKSISTESYNPQEDSGSSTSEIKSITSVNIGIIIMIILGTIIYFIPTAIAIKSKHQNKFGIIMLNIFLGWSLIGWIIAFVWAITDNKTTTITNSKYEELERLQKLKDSGTITDKEFETEKEKILK